MLDAALISKCTDPSLTSGIVEQFVEEAGSPDPLAISVKSGGRLILVPKPTTADEAMEIIRQNVGQAVVRAGLTQIPVGTGVKDASELKPDLVDACENLRMGTKLFAKVMRIVAKWYGNPTAKDVLPQIFEDAVYSWKTGEFEGVQVFLAPDPDGAMKMDRVAPVERTPVANEARDEPAVSPDAEESRDAQSAGIRIDLSRIGGQK
ncbi:MULTISPECIES: TraH family protein [Rhizobium]|uniref:Conjugal transfer protein TraH n=1 Tax=Rhizobium leguminosarum TaxID=384 RepID=A0A1B1CME2_RHILE|nr:TraH family protein [Rhizobium leguminosarum]ANP90942.1 conjugal transfer protein TraH [Rhizobium leguminosarum]API55139.1 conjugal transfer protein TraH [Rhizobium leguminosarum]